MFVFDSIARPDGRLPRFVFVAPLVRMSRLAPSGVCLADVGIFFSEESFNFYVRRRFVERTSLYVWVMVYLPLVTAEEFY